MIRIEAIKIREFRGIRELELDLDRKNFGICGPNGTGKSGLVDAIEFALTGDISRLSGRGTGDLSVKDHGPHVDMRGHPANAEVELRAFIPSLGKSATIARSVAKPRAYDLVPADPQIRQVFEELQVHPEFALSRREIIRYILAQPNQRAADVQGLLRLDEVESTRKALTTVANAKQKQRDQKQQAHLAERTTLLQLFNIDTPDHQRILDTVNEMRASLSLKPLDKLDADTAFKEGVPEAAKAAASAIKKVDAQSDLVKLAEHYGKEEPGKAAAKRTAALKVIRQLVGDADALRTLKRQSLIAAGIELVDDDSCPLCDADWERENLLSYLAGKLESARQASILLRSLNDDINHVIAARAAFASLLDRLVSFCLKLDPAVQADAIRTCAEELEAGNVVLRAFVANTSGIARAQDILEEEWWVLCAEAREQAKACAAGVAALPEVSKEDQARDFLTRAEDQFRRAVRTRLASAKADEQSTIAAKSLEIYQTQSDAVLEELYDEVADDFTAHYRSINGEDEGAFEGKLIPSAAKLGFDVDFYGRGKFPPGAYHSEGHQDGMGLCLYLALMKRTLGDGYTFSVLDDVLMSIDADHRREVCKLLVREFPSTQFILTTHDRVWLKFMHTEGLVKNSVTFSGWSVETGPKVWRRRDVWDEIEDALREDDIGTAAGKLRRYLEHIAGVLCDSLRAEVRFKGDGQYDLGDLMPPVINRWRKKLVDATKAAKSWSKDDDVTTLSAWLVRLDDARQRTQAEQWAINPAIHYNQWASFQAHEFREVVRAFADLLETMQCAVCESFIELQPRTTQPELIRCNCGEIALNLKQNSA